MLVELIKFYFLKKFFYLKRRNDSSDFTECKKVSLNPQNNSVNQRFFLNATKIKLNKINPNNSKRLIPT